MSVNTKFVSSYASVCFLLQPYQGKGICFSDLCILPFITLFLYSLRSRFTWKTLTIYVII